MAFKDELAAVWEYPSDDGDRLLYAVARYDEAGGGKRFIPLRPVEGGYAVGGLPGPLPLFGLDLLAAAADAAVYVSEGEKTADAVRALGLLGVTSAHGAKSAAKTDWTPLGGRDVRILCDNDADGVAYGDDVAAILMNLDPPAKVRFVELPGLPAKGDAFDWREAGHAAGKSDADLLAEVEDLASKAAPLTKPPTLLSEAGSDEAGPKARASLTCLADVTAQPIDWLWHGKLARGMVSMFAGNPGEGKSTLTMDICGRLTTGRTFHGDDTINPPCSVILMGGEDNLADTVRPRLDAAGADLSKVIALEGLEVRQDNGEIDVAPITMEAVNVIRDALVRKPDAACVIIDPVGEFLGSGDGNSDPEMRKVIAGIRGLAKKYDVAILLVGHLNKKQGAPAAQRIMGSAAFVGASRAVWLIGRDREGGGRVVMARIKGNNASEPVSVAFTLQGHTNGMACVSWLPGEVNVTADQLCGAEGAGGEDDAADKAGADRLAEAMAFLRVELADGPAAVIKVEAAAKGAGVTPGTLRRAREKMGIKPHKEGGRGWVLSLPDTAGTAANADEPPFG